MPLTTRSVLYVRNDGDSLTNPMIPLGPWVGQVDLSTMGNYSSPESKKTLVQAPKYEVHEIELPEWLPTERYCGDYIRWSRLWGYGADPEWPESWQRLLVLINGDPQAKIACIDLLNTKKFRSEFRSSLRDRLVTWLEDPEARFPSPFTPKQWDKLIVKYVTWKANRILRELTLKGDYFGAPKKIKSTRDPRKRTREPSCVICTGQGGRLCAECSKSYDQWNEKVSDGTTWSLIAWAAKRARSALKRQLKEKKT